MTITGVFMAAYESPMAVVDSVLVALFCVAGVFLVLICLSLIVKFFSVLLNLTSDKGMKPIEKPEAQSDFSGALKLQDVDEPTAAIIMAIVSDESKIPLDELQFKSIKLLRRY